MDIIDVLKMLSTRAGINIVVGKNVTGRVTLFLKDVGVWDAFEIILLANDLAYEKRGEIINVMTQRDYELIYGERFKDKKKARVIQLKYAKAADLSRSLNQIKTNIGRIVVDEGSNTVVLIDTPDKIKEMEAFIKKTDLLLKTQIFSLSYAQADKVSPKIQEVLTKGIGSLRIDERTNKIAITDYPDKLRDIEKILSEFDEKTPQVLIDAQIVEVSPKDEFSMGVNWDYWIEKNLRLVGSFPAPATASASVIPAKLLYGIVTRDSSASVTSLRDNKSVLDMLRIIGKTKILSSPRIMTLNNQEAKILVGTKDAYITSTTSQTGTGSTVTSQTVNFVDVGIKLYVTPTINKEGFITMKIKPEVSSSVATTLTSEDKKTQVPIVTTSEAETTIMLKDGATVMIAGLKREKKSNEIQKIPLLGDIPIIGNAFRNAKRETTTTELVIFITPHIVSGEESFTYTSVTKDKDITRLSSMSKTQEFHEILSDEAPNSQDYRQFVSNKIRKVCWEVQEARRMPKGEIEMAFLLDATGHVKQEPRVISSTNRALNDIVATCIKEASPYPPFPVSLVKNEEEFRIHLTFE